MYLEGTVSAHVRSQKNFLSFCSKVKIFRFVCKRHLLIFLDRVLTFTFEAMNKLTSREMSINKLTSVFLWVCLVLDHEFRHHIVKVAVDPQGES